MAFACEDGKEVSGIITLPQYISASAIVKPPYEADWYDRTYDSAYWDLPTNIYNPDNYELCLLTGWCNEVFGLFSWL